MPRRHNSSSSVSDSAPSSSASTSRKHRRRTPTPTHNKKMVEENDDDDDEENYNNDDFADASDSQYNEAEPKEDDDDDGDEVDNSGSKSMSNEESHSYFPENKNPSQPIVNASSSYVKIAPLPIFRGTPNESPITHLSRFNKVCKANNASTIEMQMRIFPVTLEEEAALWYDLNIEPYHPPLSWDEIKFSFLQAYYQFEPVEGLRAELMGIQQGEGESVRSYFLRLQWILKRWPEHGLDENVVKGVFVDGLRREFHDWVLMQKPESLSDALKLAFVFEKMRSVRGKVGPTCEGLHEESGCEVRERMREMGIESNEEKEERKSVNVARLLSMGESSSGGGGKGKTVETGNDDKGVEGSMKKNQQCQCTKHECGKKFFLRRNSSLQSRISLND